MNTMARFESLHHNNNKVDCNVYHIGIIMQSGAWNHYGCASADDIDGLIIYTWTEIKNKFRLLETKYFDQG